jgi:hypothetical protein
MKRDTAIWSSALVEVKYTIDGKQRQIVATMDVPKDMQDVPDHVMIERFVNGFNGGKSIGEESKNG